MRERFRAGLGSFTQAAEAIYRFLLTNEIVEGCRSSGHVDFSLLVRMLVEVLTVAIFWL
jgi:hypothetical protein